MARSRRTVGAIVVGAIVVGACSGGSDDPEPGARGDDVRTYELVQPCDVLTPDDAGAVLGMDLAEGERRSEENREGCDYLGPDGSAVAVVFHEVAVDTEEFVERLMRGQEDGDVLRPADSIADVSLWSQQRRAVVGRLGDSMIQVFVRGPELAAVSHSEAAGVALLDAFVAVLDPERTVPEPADPAPLPDGVELVDLEEDPGPTTYLVNLAKGVDDGRWTLGEGIVRTLLAELGEERAADVFARSVVDDELSGVVAAAQDYLETGDDDDARARIEELLASLVFTPEQLEGMVIGAAPDATASSGAGDGAEIRFASLVQQAEGTQDCARFFPDRAGAGIEECLAARTVSQSGVVYRIFGPDPNDRIAPSVWRERHYDLVEQAVRDAIVTYQPHGTVPDGFIVLLRHDTTSANAFQLNPCYLSVLPKAQEQSDADFRHTVAHEIAHCFQGANVADDAYPATGWVVESMAEYLANVVYPTNNKEIRVRHPTYRRDELTSTLFERTYANASWMQHYANSSGGPPALTELLRDATAGHVSGGRDGGAAAVARLGGIADLHHEFAKAITAGTLRDEGGGSWPSTTAVSRHVVTDVSGIAVHERALAPFALDRIFVTVPAGKEATLGVRFAGDLRLSYAEQATPIEWRPGAAGMELTADCEDERGFWVVSTTTEPSDRSLVLDLGVEDAEGCEEAVPEVLSTTDPCLVGTWTLHNDAYLGEIKLTDRTRREQQSSIRGTVRLAFRADKTLELSIDGYRERHDHGDGRVLEVRSSGRGSERWGADGARVNAIGIEDGFDFDTVVDGGFVGATGAEAPPENLLLFPQYQHYVCSAGALTVFYADGFITSWRR